MKFIGISMMCMAGTALGQSCGWMQMAPDDSPAKTAGHAMTYDEARGVVVFYKRYGAGPETWTWDGSNWAIKSKEGPTGGGEMAFDSARQVCILVGGSDGEEAQTWDWDGQSWMKQHPAARPHWRAEHGIAYDSKRGVTVLYGGYWEDEDGVFNLTDTWEFDGQMWKKVADGTPSDSYGRIMAYDPERGVTVLVVYSGVWEWDGQSWTKRTGEHEHPPGGLGSAMVYDADLHACVLYSGGDLNGIDAKATWAWDGQTWTKIETPDAPNSLWHK